MGLAIVRTIVERHRGRVHAENVNEGAAILRVQLPIGAADSLRARARARD
jgi:signal transduction histidine kinase